MLSVTDFSIEYRHNPIGIDEKKPRISWKLYSDEQNVKQESYRLIVTDKNEIVWDTEKVMTEQSVCILYAGKELKPQTRYKVHITIADNHGETTSSETWFETGLQTKENWKADWITHGFEDDLEACAVFKKSFMVGKKVKQARVYASALGIYEFSVNGQYASDIHFAPGWTSYQSRIQYQTYDITEFLESENEIKFTVGNGWYKGILGFFNQGNHYGTRTALIAQIVITYEDGATDIISTDETWMTTTEALRYSEIYHGEIIDYSMEKQKILTARIYHQTKDVLIAQQCEPVRITERIAGKKLLITPKKEVVIDFEQNLTGVIELNIKRPKGTRIVIRHAEALDEKGNFYTANLRTAKATDTFICSGKEDCFRPMFTYHGFRYIQIEGLGENLNAEDFTACVIHTDLERTGTFECSNKLVNRLVQNIDWGLRDNFLDIPTDCPQRDERLGYTGDAQIFLSTACCFRNVALFFEKWMQDLKYEQSLGAGVPTTVPNILGAGGGIAIWHDAATIVPWELYWNYGDIHFLEEQFDSMMSCVEYYKTMADDSGLMKTGQQLGDWVSMDVPRGPWLKRDEEVWNLELIEKMGATDPYFIANMYYAHSVSLVVKAAKVLGRVEEEERYRKQYEELLQNIRDEYITKNGRLVSETQTGCILALQFNIAEEKDRDGILHTLQENIKQHKNHLTTGFAGTPFLCPVLSENGAHEMAGSVFLKEDCPSWLYHVKLGATTMWELWDGINPDGSFNKFEMNSLNHYSYGSIGSWIYHNLLGILPLEPGYKKARIAPRMIKGVPEMRGTLDTVYGRYECAISCMNQRYIVDITVPANVTAEICLPGCEYEIVGSGRYHYEYETEDSFIKERYDMESKFGELLDNPIGRNILNQYAAELMENEMFMMFAKERPLSEVTEMLPPEVLPLLEMVVAQCNANPV